jgi:hypothetical protein
MAVEKTTESIGFPVLLACITTEVVLPVPVQLCAATLGGPNMAGSKKSTSISDVTRFSLVSDNDLRSARASRTFFHDFAELEIRQQCVCVPVVRVRTRVGYDVFFVFAFAAERAKVFFLASPQNGTLQTR